MSSLWRPGGWRTEDHSLIRTADGAIHVWGEGAHGCLGHGEDLSTNSCLGRPAIPGHTTPQIPHNINNQYQRNI